MRRSVRAQHSSPSSVPARRHTDSSDRPGQLVANLQAGGLLRSSRVRDAFSFVDRGHYVQDKGTAYQDSPQSVVLFPRSVTS